MQRLRGAIGALVGPSGGTGRRLIGAVGRTGAVYAVNLLLSLGIGVLLARLLGAADFGVYAYALAILNGLSMLVRLGFGALVMRETARAAAVGDLPLIRGLWGWILRVGLVASAVVTLGLLAGLWALGDAVSPERRAVLLAGLALAPLIGLGHLAGSALRGLQRPVAGVAPELLLRPLAQVGFVALAALWAGAGGLGAPAAMAANAAATAVYVAVAAALLLRLAPPGLRAARPARREVRAWIGAGLPLAAGAIVLQLNDQIGVLVLGSLASDAETGVFRIAAQIAFLGSLAGAPFGIVVAPLFASCFAAGDRNRLRRLARAAGRAVALIAALLLAGGVLAGRVVLGEVFGPDFAAGYLPLVIMLAGHALAALGGPTSDLLTMTGHERDAVAGTAAGLAVNAGLCLWLVPEAGGTGAAIAVASGFVVAKLWQVVAVRRRLGLDPTVFGLAAPHR